MNRKEAISILANRLKKYSIVAANGYISRDLFELFDKESNFYMIGSMGLASSIALGVAIKNPKKRIFVFDGDGNILMNFGSLATIGGLKQKNLVHVIFDNNSHESTGGQPTLFRSIDMKNLARFANYKVFETSTRNGLEKILSNIKNIIGPILIIVRIKKSRKRSKRVELDAVTIKERFINSLE